MDTATAALIGATLATSGWLYTARRARALSRKQHTVSVMLQASFNKEFRDAMVTISKASKAGPCPNLELMEHQEQLLAVRFVLNHYEFLSAGLRNGDFDERLVHDSQRGTILRIFQFSEGHIYGLRKSRDQLSLYENLEWLRIRWTKKPPGKIQRFIEFCRQQPFGGHRVDPHS